MRTIFRSIKYLIWLPLAFICNVRCAVAANLLVLWLAPHAIIISMISTFLLMGACMPIELRLRPLGRQPKATRPPAEKSLAPSLVRIARLKKDRTPSKATLLRRLPAPLRALVKQPANQKPAALEFERQRAKEMAA